MKNIFYYATIGTNIVISDDKIKDYKTDFKHCSDPISYGIWWCWNRFNAFPDTTIFSTESNEKTVGSIENFKKLKNKFEGKIEYLDIDPYNLQSNLRVLNDFFNEEFNRILKNYKDYFIVVNITSGTNPMVISLFQTIINKLSKVDLYRLKIIYIQEFKDAKKENKGSFEDMRLNELNINNMGDLILVNAANEQVLNQNFSAAYSLLEKHTSTDPSLNRLIESFRYFSRSLMLWDQFNHKSAINELKTFYKVTKDSHFIIKEQERMIEFAESKLNSIADGTFNQLSVFHIIDLLINAERRFKKKEFLDGILRLYRSIELFFELRLKEHNFKVQEPNYDLFSEEDKAKINEIYRGVLNKIDISSKINKEIQPDIVKNRVYLKEMITLLAYFDDELYKKIAAKIKIEDLLILMSTRNKSYLTHNIISLLEYGGETIKSKDVLMRFKEFLIENYGKYLFNVCNLNLNEDDKQDIDGK